ncbi:MAG: hypothetical protein AB1758_29415 [Candidatus Eremiobacterota bacterium]
MEPLIQITVRDLAVAEPFYDKFLPLLGFARAARLSRSTTSTSWNTSIRDHLTRERLQPGRGAVREAVFFKDLEGIRYEIVHTPLDPRS